MLVFRRIIVFSTFFITIQLSGYAQQTHGSLAINRDAGSISNLLADEQRQGNDTGRVALLNRIAGKYWYALTPNALDSSIFYAKQANSLSLRLHDVAGRNQALFLMCKAYTKLHDIGSAMALLKLVHGEERIRLLLVNSEYYVFKEDVLRDEIDKAYPLMSQAVALSDSVHSMYWRYQSLLLLGKYYFKKNELAKGKACFLKIIDSCRKLKETMLEGHYWSELGLYLPETDNTIKQKIIYHQFAYECYLKIKDVKDAAYSLRDIVTINFSHNQIDLALKQMLQVMSMLKTAREKISPNSYWLLSEIYDFKGMYKESLYYGLLALKANDKANEVEKYNYYIRLAYLYDEQVLTEKALEFHKLALEGFIKLNSSTKFFCCYNVVTDELILGHNNGAKIFIINFLRRNPASNPEEQELMAAAQGNVYKALGQLDLANYYFKIMIRQDEIAVNDRKTSFASTLHMKSADAYFLFADFLMSRKQYKTAKVYLLKAYSTTNTLGVGEVSNLEYQLFKVDSAMGNPASALPHFIKYHQIKDSLVNLSKSKQIAELRLTFEAAQREQSIKVLKSEAKTGHAELQRVSLQRNFTAAGIVLAGMLTALLYFFYRQKQFSNLQLQVKQNEINLQNLSLRQLVSDKNWLLKEVHHRVKNNLHMITSLLETQSSYLNNRAALEAISESQSRIKAIALIHQRLYAESNLAMIEMRSYIHELVQYLKDSYDSGRGITFNLQIDQVDCDVQQAIPIGLILNEAITNAIKYAFVDKEEGKINICLREINDSNLIFEIRDNGAGLPAGIDVEKPASMGMGLIKGLTGQLGGILTLVNNGGVHINVSFSKMRITADNS